MEHFFGTLLERNNACYGKFANHFDLLQRIIPSVWSLLANIVANSSIYGEFLVLFSSRSYWSNSFASRSKQSAHFFLRVIQTNWNKTRFGFSNLNNNIITSQENFAFKFKNIACPEHLNIVKTMLKCSEQTIVYVLISKQERDRPTTFYSNCVLMRLAISNFDDSVLFLQIPSRISTVAIISFAYNLTKQNVTTNQFEKKTENKKEMILLHMLMNNNNNDNDNEKKNVSTKNKSKKWTSRTRRRRRSRSRKIKNWYLTNLWHLVPMNAAMMLQYSHADGFPYCLTLYSHFLQIVDVLPLLF